MPSIAGTLEILVCPWMFASAYFIFSMLIIEVQRPWEDPSFLNWIWWVTPFIGCILSIMVLVGGVFALLRRRWRLALAGAFATLPLFLVAQFGGRLLFGDLGTDLTTLSFRLVYLVLPILLSAAIVTLLIFSKREFK
jgi:hypothetical protein